MYKKYMLSMCAHMFAYMWERWKEQLKRVVILMGIVGTFNSISLSTILFLLP